MFLFCSFIRLNFYFCTLNGQTNSYRRTHAHKYIYIYIIHINNKNYSDNFIVRNRKFDLDVCLIYVDRRRRKNTKRLYC